LQFKYRNRFVSSDLPQNMKVPLADREQQKPLSRKTTKKTNKKLQKEKNNQSKKVNHRETRSTKGKKKMTVKYF